MWYSTLRPGPSLFVEGLRPSTSARSLAGHPRPLHSRGSLAAVRGPARSRRPRVARPKLSIGIASMIKPVIRVRLAAWIRSGVPSNTTRIGSRPAMSSPIAGLGASDDRIPSAPFVFSHANADGWSPADEGSWPRNSGDQTSGKPPFRVAMARSPRPRDRRPPPCSPDGVRPDDAERKFSRFHRAPGPSARALLREHDPLVLLVGPQSFALNASTSFWRELSMTGGLFATVARTHAGPLADSPVTARAASVPNAAARFWMKPAPSFSSGTWPGRVEVRLRGARGELRGELLEQLKGSRGRNVQVARERALQPVDTPPRRPSRRQPATTPFPFVHP